MDIKFLYEQYLKSHSVSIDSRNIAPGALFFALKGENSNGNQFAESALEKGALAAIVDEEPAVKNERIFRVNNTLQTLSELATYHRKQSGVTILAITGSNGKTTTKELCNATLSTRFKVHATQGNLNNHIGVPLTLLSMPQNCELAVVEMGANHPGEIAALCEIALPDHGLITNIGKAHLEGFGGIEGVARAKGELFNHLMKRGKSIFLNEGNPYLRKLVPPDYPGVVRYNSEKGLRILSMESNPLLNVEVSDNHNIHMTVKTNLVGSYNAENVTAACCVGLQFGISPENITAAISQYVPKNNRSQLINTSRNTVFMDAYNANPSSMSAAINEFLRFRGENKLLIIGEMREVGDSSPAEHKEIIDQLVNQHIGNVICVGSSFEPFAVKAGFRYAANVDELNEMLMTQPVHGHFVFVKGSRSNHLEKAITLL